MSTVGRLRSSLLLSLAIVVGCGGSGGGSGPTADEALLVSAASNSNVRTTPYQAATGFTSVSNGSRRVFTRDAAQIRNVQIQLPEGSTGVVNIGGAVTMSHGQEIPGTDGGNWLASGGTIEVLSLSASSVRLRIANATFSPAPDPGNSATGTFTLNGTLELVPNPN